MTQILWARMLRGMALWWLHMRNSESSGDLSWWESTMHRTVLLLLSFPVLWQVIIHYSVQLSEHSLPQECMYFWWNLTEQPNYSNLPVNRDQTNAIVSKVTRHVLIGIFDFNLNISSFMFMFSNSLCIWTDTDQMVLNQIWSKWIEFESDTNKYL